MGKLFGTDGIRGVVNAGLDADLAYKVGLAAAQGMALGLKLNGSPARVYAVLGDGEQNEGAVWEAAMSAPKFALDNLCAVTDYNKVQLDGTTLGFVSRSLVVDLTEAVNAIALGLS